MIGDWRHLNKDGKIPAHTVCPFREKCGLVDGCHHKGETHAVDFSCAAARAFDMIVRGQDKAQRVSRDKQNKAHKKSHNSA